jgi:RNA polymerase sporulation-specific sigma factor
MENKTLSDEALVKLSREGDSQADSELLERYSPVVRHLIGSYYLVDGDREDLFQEGLLGLMKAVKTYDIDKSNRFYPFAKMCINSQLIKAIERSNTEKNRPLNSYLSIEENGALINDYLIDEIMDPERLLLDKENFELLKNAIIKILSPMETEVFTLLIQGYNYKDIADILEKSPKNIDNAIQRIKNKVRSSGGKTI